MTDMHVRRSAADYAQALSDLLPQGSAWPRDPASPMQKAISGLCGIWGAPDPNCPLTGTIPATNVDGRAADLLEIESDPRTTVQLLPDWERAFGLPDLCLAEPLTIGDRQKALVARLTMLGGQSRDWFVQYAKTIGYNIEIIEHSPFMFGVSHFGDTRNWLDQGSPWYRWELGPPTIRFYWTIAPQDVRLTWFRFGGGGGQFGVDPMLLIAHATDLECAMQRYHPAHTALSFSYGGLMPFNPLSGTP